METGSEFRDWTKLTRLFKNHRLENKLKQIATKGITYELEELSEENRRKDLDFMMRRGNHKSASEAENEPALLENYEKEVRYGWMLPVTIESVSKIKGSGVIPVGVAAQWTMDERGNRKQKRRTTHDTSLPPPSTKSTNERMNRETLTECIYGHCLIKLLHAIHMMRFYCPHLAILISKLEDCMWYQSGQSK